MVADFGVKQKKEKKEELLLARRWQTPGGGRQNQGDATSNKPKLAEKLVHSAECDQVAGSPLHGQIS